MEPIQEQKEANRFLEGGIFYPTGHVVTGFDQMEDLKKAHAALSAAGFEDEHLLIIDSATMVREAGENLDQKGVLSAGSSVPTRQKQLELAEQGFHFLIIYAPEDADHERVISLLHGSQVRYAVKYRRLIIENLIDSIVGAAADKERARVP